MEQERGKEIDPQILEDAKTIITELGFGEHADRVVEYEGQKFTIAEGLAHHWEESMMLDGEELFNRILGYVSIADIQGS